MDKQNTIIGSALIAIAIIFIVFGQHFTSPPQVTPAQVRQAAADQGVAAAPAAAAPTFTANTSQDTFQTASTEGRETNAPALENSFIRAQFTEYGGAVQNVSFKKYPAEINQPNPYVFNALHADPMLAFVGNRALDSHARFTLVSHTDREVVYRASVGSLEVTRTYTIAGDQAETTDPYQLRSETTFRNVGKGTSAAMELDMSVGTAAPVNLLDRGFQLTTGYSSGSDQTFVNRDKLAASSGFFGLNPSPAKPSIDYPGPIVWGTATNQFFASILTPDQPATRFTTRRVKLLTELPDDQRNAYGVAATLTFQLPALAPGASASLGSNLYVGPKEYHRLANPDVFKADQEKVMQFGMFKFFSALLLTLMTKVHAWFPYGGWGVSIVLTTLTIRFVFLAFTIPAARSARRMQQIQPEIQAVKEKFKDNPQKQQAATLELFKKHKVNPLGGCLPMLIPMPFFFGFFRMLNSTAELRFAPFLWAHDLSAPDTVMSIGHGLLPIFGSINLNILPLLFAATTFIQMQLTPQPTVDNAQAKMMKFMPIMMLMFYYSYSCALSLYSTANGLFMIGQQLLVNRMKHDGDPTHDPAAAGARPVKNVSPPKKR